MADDWGPIGPLVGEWEGEGGLDTAFSHAREEVLGTPYLARSSDTRLLHRPGGT